jgi:hypothetical protein
VKLEEPYPYLTVQTSVFALAVAERDGNPAVRIEFDRDRGYEPEDTKQQGHKRSAAHVQIHGVSAEISYLQGRQKAGKLNPLQDFHFPVGGRRFRPSDGGPTLC